jgi:hypothetical protein
VVISHALSVVASHGAHRQQQSKQLGEGEREFPNDEGRTSLSVDDGGVPVSHHVMGPISCVLVSTVSRMACPLCAVHSVLCTQLRNRHATGVHVTIC